MRACERRMTRVHQAILIGSILVASWLGMQAIHECGHVIGALMTGGEIKQVVLNPLSFSRTDLGLNPNPLTVVWAGPIFGALLPLVAWMISAKANLTGAYLLRFFAGFCALANGVYLGFGSFGQVGDCAEILRHGGQIWQLWLFAFITVPTGLWLWHGQSIHFGFGPAHGHVDRCATYMTSMVALFLIAFGFIIGGK